MYTWPPLGPSPTDEGGCALASILVAGAPGPTSVVRDRPVYPSASISLGTRDSGLYPHVGSHTDSVSVGHQWQPEEPIPCIRHTTLPCYPKVVGRPPVLLTPVCSYRGVHLLRRMSTAPVRVVVDVRLRNKV